ncbi:hypothetical protein BLS_006917 [Venturia inaequalis]|uniref:Uncharacterized protein n=1 Tax=Venturia inaequalis TaxID=5025 RepID=A0A8H3Z6Y3_VENIN|nr:hypothetical protein BLS_006917 [Venturia inaequalis]
MTEGLASSGSHAREAEDNNCSYPNFRPRPTIPTNNRSTGTFPGPHSLSLALSQPPSAAASPRSSRDSSPAGRSFRLPTTPGAASSETPEEPDARAGASTGKAPSRGASGAPTLETVQESSAPTTPGDTPANGISSAESPFVDAQSEDDHEGTSGSTTPRTGKANITKGDSGSDTGAEKKNDRQNKDAEEQDPDATPRAKAVIPRASVSSLRPKAEASAKNMTVETETISSIPQGTLGPPADRIASGRIEHGGTLRAKASSDTIRPNKGRKKASRKAPSINNTSDRVKNAMEDATSDDSDETFVYESNPPEPAPARRSRHHSRTPSGASAISNSNIDQRGLLRLNHSLSTQKTRSMKFTNAYNSGDEESVDRGGTIRASMARGGSSSVHHHHLSRPGRNGNGHTSILDEDNGVFNNHLSKVPSFTGLPRQVPRLNNQHLQATNGSARREAGYASYDVDADGGDDEGTPLIGTGTVRTPRGTKRSSPLQASRPPQYLDHYPSGAKSIVRRCAGCIVMLVMILLMIFGVVAFLFAISTPLSNVRMVEIQAVLASEQELMFDIVVESENPNLLPITIADTDFSVFARSKYVGSEKWWREHGDESMPPLERTTRRRNRIGTKSSDQVTGESWWNPKPEDKEEPWTPFPEPDDTEDHEGVRPTMVLGRIYKLETPLSFDGSFWKKHKHVSTATLRLLKPGNSTEMGGTARWERVLLHPFDLIVRGSLKYNIPLGGHSYAVAVSNEVTIHPEEGDVVPVDPEDGVVKISRSLDRYRESTAMTSAPSEDSWTTVPRHGFASRVKSTLLRAFPRR